MKNIKNYVIITLCAIILLLCSVIYKNTGEQTLPAVFPLPEEVKSIKEKVPLFLFVFFSKTNCTDCLEVMETLNRLPPYFPVFGIVPDHELEDEKELRGITGAAFPLLPGSRFRKFIPWYAPTIVAVSPKGERIFELPGVPGEKEYLLQFLDALYGKVLPVFLEEASEKK